MGDLFFFGNLRQDNFNHKKNKWNEIFFEWLNYGLPIE